MTSNDLAYGVQYTPESETNRGGSAGLTVNQLMAMQVRYVRVTWVDLTNVVRYRVIPFAYFKKILASPRPCISMIQGALGMVAVQLAEGFAGTGEYLYRPDMDSMRLCGYAPGHAACLGWYEEKVPCPGPDHVPTLDVDLCPRALLKRVVADAKATSNVEFLVGFESEFILLKSTAPIAAVSEHPWSSSLGLYSGAPQTEALEEIADALQRAGIELQMYHAEAAPGQYEVVTGPLTPLKAADALVHTRETIVNIANKHGLRATFAPRVYMNSCGSSTHTHISVHASTPPPNLPPSPAANLTPLEACFLSGVLAALPGLALLGLPTPASYKRVQDGIWSGGTYVCWGTDLREAPVRLCNAASPPSRNFELRTVDGTANPYLALAGVLGAGARAVRAAVPLVVRDCGLLLVRDGGGQTAPIQVRTPAEMNAQERAAYGVVDRMPLSWEEARNRFKGSPVVREIVGKRFVEKYLSVNELLGRALNENKTEEEALQLLVRNY